MFFNLHFLFLFQTIISFTTRLTTNSADYWKLATNTGAGESKEGERERGNSKVYSKYEVI